MQQVPNEMKTLFLEKYKEYCKENDSRGDDIFRISQKEDETLEDYISRFLHTLPKNHQNYYKRIHRNQSF